MRKWKKENLNKSYENKYERNVFYAIKQRKHYNTFSTSVIIFGVACRRKRAAKIIRNKIG